MGRSAYVDVRRTAALVAGGRSGAALSASIATLDALPERTWCAVGPEDDLAGTAGLALLHRLDPWPGRVPALERVWHRVAGEISPDDPVVLIAAGTLLQRRFLAEAGALLAGGAGLVLGTPGDGRGTGAPGRLRTRFMPQAVLRPGSGLVVRGDVLATLVDRGWLRDQQLTVDAIGRIGGDIRVLPRSIRAYRPEELPSQRPPGTASVTVLVPAHNEEAWIGDTLRSLQTQTRRPDKILLVDDCSTDRTGDIGRHLGARVLRTPANRLKAGAQNYGLEHVTSDIVVTLDADTVLHPQAMEALVTSIEDGNDATHGAVEPRFDKGVWARGRVVEYAVARRLYKRVQLTLGSVVVLSGCIAAMRTSALRAVGGFTERTLTEDLDLTWTLLFAGYRVGFTAHAIGYPVEPTSWRLFKGQMRRWGAGFYQNVGVHRGRFRDRRSLGLVVGGAVWDVALTFILILVAAALTVSGHGYRPAVKFAVIFGTIYFGAIFAFAASVVGFRRTAASFPAYLVVSNAGLYFYFEAMLRVWVFRRKLRTWTKGH